MIRKNFLQRVILAVGIIFISFAWTTSSSAVSSEPITQKSISTTVTITTSGSVNICTYVIHISLVADTNNVTYTTCNSQQGQKSLPRVLTENFLHDINAAQPLDALPQPMGCIKSKSFGTNTYIEYGTQKSPDVSCAVNTIEKKLAADARAIKMALKVNTLIPRPIEGQ